jgi:hypothetical protein
MRRHWYQQKYASSGGLQGTPSWTTEEMKLWKHYTVHNRSYRRIWKKLERACWKDECSWDPPKYFKYQPKGKRSLGRPLK